MPAGVFKKTWRDGFWSLAGTVANVFAGLATVRIIALWIPRDKYGEASLVLGIITLLNSFLIGPLMSAHLRIYFDYQQRGVGQWFRQFFYKVCFLAGITCAGMYMLIGLGWWVAGSPYFVQMAIPAMLLIVLQPFMSVTTNYLEAHRLYFRLAMVNAGQKLLLVPSLLLLLYAPISAASAVVLSQAMAILPLIVSSHGVLARASAQLAPKPATGGETTREVVRQFSAFGLALPLGYVIHWLLSTSDRYLIAHFMTTQDVGVYAMNYGFWSIPYIMLGGWLEILTRPRVYQRASHGDWRGVRNILAARMGLTLGLGLAGSGALVLVGQRLSSIMLGPAYQTGWGVPTNIAIAHLFMILGYAAVPVFLATKKMNVILYATATAAVLNVCLNLWTIPKYGLVGAAMSTMVAYLLWAIIIVAAAVKCTARLCAISVCTEKVL